MARHYKSMGMGRKEMHMERMERPRNTNYEQPPTGGRLGGGKKHAMEPNMPRASFIEEDWNEPALLKRGVHEFGVTYGANRHRSGRLGDLYEQVTKTTMEDQAAFDKLTDPHNW
jgi:hypothetical protein